MDERELTDTELSEWQEQLADLWKQREKPAQERESKKSDEDLDGDIKYMTERIEYSKILKMKKGDPKGEAKSAGAGEPVDQPKIEPHAKTNAEAKDKAKDKAKSEV